MVAMLGNTSWFHILQNDTIFSDSNIANAVYTQICNQRPPLMLWDISGVFSNTRTYCDSIGTDIDGNHSVTQLQYMAESWFSTLVESNSESVLTAALFFANEATLTRAGATTNTAGVKVYESTGRTVTKPNVPLAAKIVVSVLLGLEVVGLLALTVFTYRAPTFTKRIDAVAAAVIGAQLFAPGQSVPQLGNIDAKARAELAERDGLIGVCGGQMAPGTAATGQPEAAPLSPDVEMQDLSHQDWGESAQTRAFQAPVGSLVVGGMGIISRKSGKS
jgi:hypothetical protein